MLWRWIPARWKRYAQNMRAVFIPPPPPVPYTGCSALNDAPMGCVKLSDARMGTCAVSDEHMGCVKLSDGRCGV
jgi:hypothetical protein